MFEWLYNLVMYLVSTIASFFGGLFPSPSSSYVNQPKQEEQSQEPLTQPSEEPKKVEVEPFNASEQFQPNEQLP
jgi:hypothetical protein